MRIQLADFQQEAVDKMLTHLRRARGEVLEDASARQALCLTAPTGAGKTVIVAAVIEAMLRGDGFEFENGPAVLWMTDSPELNEQSRRRLSNHIDSAWNDRIVTIDEKNFDQPSLPRGVWFLNTQKLGKDTRLANPGDRRSHTFWETVGTTIRQRSGDLILIVDEAHRGTTLNKGDLTESRTIVQRFIMGYGTMPAVPLLVGVSATPQRFYDLLASLPNRPTVRDVSVNPEDVRRSGFLKQKTQLRGVDNPRGAEHTLLEDALRQYSLYVDAWAEEAEASAAECVKPVMLIQVEDAARGSNKGPSSRTDLDAVVKTVKATLSNVGKEEDKAIAHAFQDSEALRADGWDIRHLKPSDIDNDERVRVVLFKSALTTGWDCPRAEVMMSYRSAKDETAIAQLVGRMVRAPLRREIPGNELLNGVDLYLPRFDAEALERVVARLQDDTSDERIPTRTVVVRELSINPDLKENIEQIRAALAETPTFEPAPRRKRNDVERLATIAKALQRDETASPVLKDATEIARDFLVARVKKLYHDYSSTDDLNLQEAAKQILFVESIFRTVSYRSNEADERADQKDPAANTKLLPVRKKDLERRFTGLNKAIGDGVLQDSLRQLKDTDERPDSRRLLLAELIALFEEPDINAASALQEHARDLITQWDAKYRQAVETLPDRERDDLLKHFAEPNEAIRRRQHPNTLPDEITVRQPPANAPRLERHIYTEGDDQTVQLNLNGWEQEAIEASLEDDQVKGWLRNERTAGRWRLAVPYHDIENNEGLLYPDLLLFREENGQIVVDVVDPHGLHLSDALYKLHGLANFAKEHCPDTPLGRVVVVAEVDGRRCERDLSIPEVADAALACLEPSHMVTFFKHGEGPPSKAVYEAPAEERDDPPLPVLVAG